MFKKVLVANRGAIATRIFRTLRELGIGSVAVYSEADRASLHAAYADEAFALGAGSPAETYLAVDRIVAVARRAGMTTMTEDGVAKCRAGITTLDEVFRVTMSL